MRYHMYSNWHGAWNEVSHHRNYLPFLLYRYSRDIGEF